MYTQVFVHAHTHAQMYTQCTSDVHVCINTHTYVCIYTHMHAHTPAYFRISVDTLEMAEAQGTWMKSSLTPVPCVALLALGDGH